MEVVEIKKDTELAELVKCKADEILFIRYDPTKNDVDTSQLLTELLQHCQDLGVACLCMPKSDDDVYVELEQWDVDRLRNFDNKLQELIRKKSPIILGK